MKKDDLEIRAEYKRSDFLKLERGKFYKEAAGSGQRSAARAAHAH
jgi:hypothetical protein